MRLTLTVLSLAGIARAGVDAMMKDTEHKGITAMGKNSDRIAESVMYTWMDGFEEVPWYKALRRNPRLHHSCPQLLA